MENNWRLLPLSVENSSCYLMLLLILQCPPRFVSVFGCSGNSRASQLVRNTAARKNAGKHSTQSVCRHGLFQPRKRRRIPTLWLWRVGVATTPFLDWEKSGAKRRADNRTAKVSISGVGDSKIHPGLSECKKVRSGLLRERAIKKCRPDSFAIQ